MALPQAFLAIERTMAAAMRSVWEKRAQEIGSELQAQVDQKRWADAQDVINGLTLDGVVSDVRPKIEELAVSALLFGAHHVTGSVKETTFVKGKAIPQELHNAIDQLVHSVEQDGRDTVCKQLHSAIEAMKRLDDASHVQKDDISTGQLAETGGLLEPDLATPKKKRKLKKGDKTLYIHRDLLNTDDFIAWAKGQGFKTTVPVDDMHVTLCYSKTPVDWAAMGDDLAEVTVMAGPRAIHQFNKGAVVLEFESEELRERNAELLANGVTTDFPEFHSHVTITYDLPEGLVVATIEPYHGPLIFGPEIFKEIKGKGWSADDMEEEVLKWERLFKADKSLQDQINDAVRNGGQVAIDSGAGMTTSRLVSLGFLSEATDAGVTTYQVDEVLDGRTCGVCQYMHGKTFDVAQQMSRISRALSSSDPADLRDAAPWPDQSKAGLQDLYAMTGEEMQAQGYASPPYHPGCRGMLKLVGTVQEDIPLGGGDLAIATDTGLQLPDFGGVTPETAADPSWDKEAVQALNWDRFSVTDPAVLQLINDAFEAEDYDTAQKLVTAFKEHDQATLDEAQGVSKDEGDDTPFTTSPNEGKKKRKAPVATGQGQDYSDIQPDDQSEAFDILTQNDSAAPLDRN